MDKVKTTQVIGIASGKGGVGKTTVSVNLAVALQAMGQRVMLFDADMSLANAQIAYKGTGDLANATKAGWGTSALLKLWPF